MKMNDSCLSYNVIHKIVLLLKNNKKPLFFLCWVVVVNVFILLLGSISVAVHAHLHIKNIMVIVGERGIGFVFIALLSLLPFILFIRNRFYILLWMTMFFSLFSMINIWYFRMFDVVMPVEMYGEFQNLKGLGGSIVGLMRWTDLFFILVPLGLICIYFFNYRNEKMAMSVGGRLFFIVIVLCFSLLPYAAASNSLMLGMGERDSWHSQGSLIRKYSILPVVVKSYVYSYRNTNIPLERNRRSALDAYFQVRAQRLDSIITFESRFPARKNMIFILLESFNTSVVEKQFDGKYVTPTLFELSKSDSTLYCPRMKVPVPACSIAGQFSLLTGLFDLPVVRFVMENPNSAYQSIIKNLRDSRDNFVSKNILATERDFWQQNIVDLSLGVDSLYGSVEYYNSVRKSPKTWMSDSNLFDYAQMHLQEMNDRSFYMMLVTLDMHSPYIKVLRDGDDDVIIDSLDYPSELAPTLKVYYQRAHLLDSYIARFIAYLKDAGLYDDTMIVITSDHNPHLNFFSGVSMESSDSNDRNTISEYVPLFILNSGRVFEPNDFRNRVVIQHQLYPTMLQLLSLKTNGYAGLCPSILDTLNYHDSDFEDVRTMPKECCSREY